MRSLTGDWNRDNPPSNQHYTTIEEAVYNIYNNIFKSKNNLLKDRMD